MSWNALIILTENIIETPDLFVYITRRDGTRHDSQRYQFTKEKQHFIHLHIAQYFFSALFINKTACELIASGVTLHQYALAWSARFD